MLSTIPALLSLALAFAPPDFARDSSGAAVNGQTVAAPATPRVQRIAILPDRTTGRPWGLPYLRTAVEDFGLIRPDAVFTVGDMVQGYTRSVEQWDREVAEYQAIVADLKAPFFPTPGNHDVISGTRVVGDDTFAQRYRARLGPLWYAVDLELATFIVLFSDEGLGDRNLRIGDEQLTWLKGALDRAAARGKPIAVLMHRPLWHSRSVQWNERVQPLLEAAKVKAVVAGHFHAMQRDPDVGGVQYHILGTCGGMIDQPPLAGQLQHITFADATATGELRIWHMPVGMALPDDFIRARDQEKVWKLRDPSPAVALRGTWPGPITLEVRNPTDTSIAVTLAPKSVLLPRQGDDSPPLWWTPASESGAAPWSAGINGWTSHTAFDIDNPHTMRRGGVQVVNPAGPVLVNEVPPGGKVSVPLELKLLLEGVPPDAPPPQLDLYVTFTDSRGREVPVFMPTRVPMKRTVSLGAEVDQATAWPIVCWEYSPYDTREANPVVRVALEGTPRQPELVLRVDVPDQLAMGAPDPEANPERHAANPPADAVVVTLSGPGVQRTWLVEPFTAAWQPSEGLVVRRLEQHDEAWSVTLSVPWPAGLAPGDASLQVGVADNDATYHTQWRWLVPKGGAAPLAAPVPAAPKPVGAATP